MLDATHHKVCVLHKRFTHLDVTKKNTLVAHGFIEETDSGNIYHYVENGQEIAHACMQMNQTDTQMKIWIQDKMAVMNVIQDGCLLITEHEQYWIHKDHENCYTCAYDYDPMQLSIYFFFFIFLIETKDFITI